MIRGIIRLIALLNQYLYIAGVGSVSWQVQLFTGNRYRGQAGGRHFITLERLSLPDYFIGIKHGRRAPVGGQATDDLLENPPAVGQVSSASFALPAADRLSVRNQVEAGIGK